MRLDERKDSRGMQLDERRTREACCWLTRLLGFEPACITIPILLPKPRAPYTSYSLNYLVARGLLVREGEHRTPGASGAGSDGPACGGA
jgi:hypothetical protein